MQSDIDKWLKELRKGSTKLAMLTLLNRRDMYGYEITKELSGITNGVISLKESNAYPALHTMEPTGSSRATGRRPSRACRPGSTTASPRRAVPSSRR